MNMVGPLAVRVRTLIDGSGGPPVDNATALVEGGRIRAIGRAGDVEIPAGAEIIDLGERVLLPGLIDMHGHMVFSLDSPRTVGAQLGDSVPDQVVSAVTHMRRKLRLGVTTQRNMSEKQFVDVAVRKAIESGRIPGPRLYIATRGLRASHSHGYAATVVDGPEALRLAVRENIAQGADLIKIYLTGEAGERVGFIDDRGTVGCCYTDDEIRAVLDEATRMGKKVAAHCLGGPGLRAAVGLGVHSIEHGFFMNDEDIECLRAAGRWLVVTLGQHHDRLRSETDAYLSHARQVGTPNCLRAIRAGVRWTIGSDSGGEGLAHEIQILVRNGIPVMDAVVAATRSAAECLERAGELGTLEAGKIADMIALDGDPLRDPGAFDRVAFVMKAGQRFDALSAL
jgi:imidazolonepropionase-like amidohydrolase